MFFFSKIAHDSQGGHWLIRKAEFNVGSHINSMFRLKCKVNDPNLDKRSSLADKRQVTYCSKRFTKFIILLKINKELFTANLDGGIGFYCRLAKKLFEDCLYYKML